MQITVWLPRKTASPEAQTARRPATSAVARRNLGIGSISVCELSVAGVRDVGEAPDLPSRPKLNATFLRMRDYLPIYRAVPYANIALVGVR